MKSTSESVLELQPPALAFDEVRPSSHLDFAPRRRPPANQTSGTAFPAIVIGTLAGFNASRTPIVDFPGNKSGIALPARSMIALNERDAGCEIALTFEEGAATKPVILGRLQPRNTEAGDKPVQVSLDGEQISLSAKNEIVLRCGRASITLTRAGKIIIRGTYLLGRSSGVNRIKGGSVQIN